MKQSKCGFELSPIPSVVSENEDSISMKDCNFIIFKKYLKVDH